MKLRDKLVERILARIFRPRVVAVRIAREEWTAANADLARQFVKSTTFERLNNILNGYLVDDILKGADDGFRRGYLGCLMQLRAFGEDASPVPDSDETETMQDADEFE